MKTPVNIETSTSSVRDFLTRSLSFPGRINYQLSPEDLIRQAVEKGEGVLSDTGALVINTGEFTGRSPKDRFIVKDALTATAVDWNEFNQPLEPRYYHSLLTRLLKFISDKKLWVRDCFVCAKPEYRVNIRVVNENPCCSLFAYNMFLRPQPAELPGLKPDWHLLQLPRFFADPSIDGVPRKNFVVINFTEKMILIGGTQYTGEIKKAVFSILNFILPLNRGVLSMHCAVNTGINGDTAVFFGLSGTGKTTLSTDPQRKLIGDDEHGWADHSVFNFEGGCYAKTINLQPEKEPQIFDAIRHGAIVENVGWFEGTNRVDFSSLEITENTRASYPLHYIGNAKEPAVAAVPGNIFFLAADAYGVLPPIARLTPAQAMYHFLSGYTAKLAGTEAGVLQPKPVFSACFGAPFIPLSPACYAGMLGQKLNSAKVQVWMLNTGWFGGAYGTGERMPLQYTRAMISAVFNGSLKNVKYDIHPVFGTAIPACCPGVPDALLNPALSWQRQEDYRRAANKLAGNFIENFKKYSNSVSKEVLEAGPKLLP